MSIRSLSCSTAVRLKAVPPFNFLLTVRKPAGWPFLTPYEIFEEGTLWTVMRASSGETYGLKLRSVGTVEKPEIHCELFSDRQLLPEEEGRLTSDVAWVLGLEEDLKEFHALAQKDSLVKSLLEDLFGMRRTKRPDVFSGLILAVTLQMAPIKRSRQMMNLLIENYGERVRFDGREILYWPSPERVAEADVKELETKCKLGYRAKTLRNIAQTISKGFPTPRELEKMPPDEARARLMELKGIGEYSADVVSPHPGFALDVWSAKIFKALLLREEAESPRSIIPKLRKIAEERWGRWRGYVFTYALNDLNNLSKKLSIDFIGL